MIGNIAVGVYGLKKVAVKCYLQLLCKRFYLVGEYNWCERIFHRSGCDTFSRCDILSTQKA